MGRLGPRLDDGARRGARPPRFAEILEDPREFVFRCPFEQIAGRTGPAAIHSHVERRLRVGMAESAVPLVEDGGVESEVEEDSVGAARFGGEPVADPGERLPEEAELSRRIPEALRLRSRASRRPNRNPRGFLGARGARGSGGHGLRTPRSRRHTDRRDPRAAGRSSLPRGQACGPSGFLHIRNGAAAVRGFFPHQGG